MYIMQKCKKMTSNVAPVFAKTALCKPPTGGEAKLAIDNKALKGQWMVEDFIDEQEERGLVAILEGAKAKASIKTNGTVNATRWWTQHRFHQVPLRVGQVSCLPPRAIPEGQGLGCRVQRIMNRRHIREYKMKLVFSIEI